ncbi:MAG TPA: hypothetical protein VMW35_11345 [Myxococcota bacterium]|nr:hypothetical protein [Myxococcota bacterium]
MGRGVRHGLRGAFVAAVFATGYLVGTTTHPTAEAQMGEMGSEMMKKAAESGGPLGQAAKLGTAITEMQKNVDELNKNLGVLKEIQGALGG